MAEIRILDEASNHRWNLVVEIGPNGIEVLHGSGIISNNPGRIDQCDPLRSLPTGQWG